MSHFATLHAALLRPLVAAVGLSLALSVPAGAAEDDAPDVDDTVSGRKTATAVGDVDLMDRAEWDARLAVEEDHPLVALDDLGDVMLHDHVGALRVGEQLQHAPQVRVALLGDQDPSTACTSRETPPAR